MSNIANFPTHLPLKDLIVYTHAVPTANLFQVVAYDTHTVFVLQ